MSAAASLSSPKRREKQAKPTTVKPVKAGAAADAVGADSVSRNEDDVVSLSESVVSCFCHHGKLVEMKSHFSELYLCDGCGYEGPSWELWTKCSGETCDCDKTFCDSCDQRWINFQ